MSLKLLTKKPVTIIPTSVGTSLPLSEPVFSVKTAVLISLSLEKSCLYFLSCPS